MSETGGAWCWVWAPYRFMAPILPGNATSIKKVEQDLRGKLGLPATGEIYYVQDRPLYQEYENLVLTTYDKWFGYHP